MMGQVFFIIWRESAEALLVIGILYAWLNNKGIKHQSLPYLWGGVVLGILTTLIISITFLRFNEILSNELQTYFQISIMLIATMLVIHTVLWMHKHGYTLKKNIELSLENTYKENNFWKVFWLVAITITREGTETAIFLYSIGLNEINKNFNFFLIESILGFSLAILSCYIIQLSSQLFSWKRFFNVTQIILLCIASNFLLTGIEKLIDCILENFDSLFSLNFIFNLTTPLWNSSWLLHDSSIFGNLIKTLTGYRAQPTLINVLTYITYWILVCYKLKHSKI